MTAYTHPTNKSLADIMAKCCVVFSQSPFEDLTTFRVRHVLLLVSILTSNATGQWFVRGIHRSPVNFPHKGQWRGALMLCMLCAWINGWVNNRVTGDLRHHRAHYDVIVMRKCVSGRQICAALLIFRKFLLKREYLGWNSLRTCKKGLMIRKFSLAKARVCFRPKFP